MDDFYPPQRDELCHLDTLPAHCELVMDVAYSGSHVFVRFRAIKPRRRWRRQASAWSGWFEYNGQPISLRWDTFWVRP